MILVFANNHYAGPAVTENLARLAAEQSRLRPIRAHLGSAGGGAPGLGARAPVHAGREVNLNGLRCEDFEVDCLPDTRDEFPRAAEYARLEVG
jgi:hypothetical protein